MAPERVSVSRILQHSFMMDIYLYTYIQYTLYVYACVRLGGFRGLQVLEAYTLNELHVLRIARPSL